jgi:hypothetical protein
VARSAPRPSPATAPTPATTAPTPATTAPAPAAASAPKPSLEERLKRLKDLADQGLITADEYARRKAELLKEL